LWGIDVIPICSPWKSYCQEWNIKTRRTHLTSRRHKLQHLWQLEVQLLLRTEKHRQVEGHSRQQVEGVELLRVAAAAEH
jgi:hypothetical protein